MREPHVELILTADFHIFQTPPISRACEKDWFGVQKRYLDQIKAIAEVRTGAVSRRIPIVVAGDIFHKPDPSIECVNWAIENMPHVYAVPGNHELKNHARENQHKSAYHTLVQAGKVTDLKPGKPTMVSPGICLHGHPFGMPVEPYKGPNNSLVWDIAVTHEYVWTDRTGHTGAKEEAHLRSLKQRGRGYDLIVCGDNHQPFVATKTEPHVLNCGSLMRRDATQLDYEPCVWLLMSDRTLVPHFLDISGDRMVTPEEVAKLKVGDQDLTEFLDAVLDVKSECIDWPEAVMRTVERKNASDLCKAVVRSCLEVGRG